MRGAAILLAAVLAACTSAPTPRGPPAAHTASPRVKPDHAPSSTHFPARPTLADVLARVDAAPGQQAARVRVAERAAEIEQTDLLPNPTLSVQQRFEPSDVSGGVRKTSIEGTERIETAGKRRSRVVVARRARDEAGAQVAVERRQRVGDAAAAFEAAAGAARVGAERRAALAVAREITARARSLLKAGRATESDLPPLLAIEGRLEVGIGDAERTERAALRRLEGILGLPQETIESVRGAPLDQEIPLPSKAMTRLAQHPDVIAARAAVQSAQARTRLEEARAVPDVKVGLGYEAAREMEDRADTIGFGVEIALPVFDRNQGAIDAAEKDEHRAKLEVEEALDDLRGSYAATYEEIRSLRQNQNTYDQEILPALERDLALAKAANAAGRTDTGAVLTAKASLADARIARAEIAAELASDTAKALALLGRL